MTNELGISLEDVKVSRLRDVAASAGIEPTGKKAEVIERLREENVELGAEGWTKDGEPFEVQERSNGGRSGDTNIIYGFRRKSCDEERLEEIAELFEDTEYEIRTGETNGGKETFRIVIPAEEG